MKKHLLIATLALTSLLSADRGSQADSAVIDQHLIAQPYRIQLVCDTQRQKEITDPSAIDPNFCYACGESHAMPQSKAVAQYEEYKRI